jgi:hypothetical protein
MQAFYHKIQEHLPTDDLGNENQEEPTTTTTTGPEHTKLKHTSKGYSTFNDIYHA